MLTELVAEMTCTALIKDSSMYKRDGCIAREQEKKRLFCSLCIDLGCQYGDKYGFRNGKM